jgi:hypothetical protein
VLDIIGARFEHSSRKSFTRIVHEAKVQITAFRKETKTSHLRPYKIIEAQAVDEGYYEIRTHFCNWTLRAVYEDVLDLNTFTGDALFHLSGYISAQNYRYWISINQRQSSEDPDHDQKFGVWCAITATRIVGPMLYIDW